MEAAGADGQRAPVWRVAHARGAFRPRGVRIDGGRAADFSDRDDVALIGCHDWTGNRRVLVQRQVSPGLFIARAVVPHQLSHACFVERDYVIETLAPRRAHKSLDEWILPRCVRRRDHVLHAHRFCGGADVIERVVVIVEQIARRLVPGKRLADLLGRPQAAVGCAVTAMCRIRRRAWASSTSTNTRRNVTVGTTKKSAAMIWPT